MLLNELEEFLKGILPELEQATGNKLTIKRIEPEPVDDLGLPGNGGELLIKQPALFGGGRTYASIQPDSPVRLYYFSSDMVLPNKLNDMLKEFCKGDLKVLWPSGEEWKPSA